MEGVAGISRWGQVSAGAAGYEEGRRLYTEELNAAVRGAFAGGASEVVVMDCHGAGGDWSFNSLIPEALDARCEFVVQTRWTEYTAMLEDGCDVALFVGQHARAGTRTACSRTRSARPSGTTCASTARSSARRDQRRPVRDLGHARRARDGRRRRVRGGERAARPRLKTLAVKQGLGRFSARHLSPVRARELLEAAARDALADFGDAPVYDPGAPCTIEVELGAPDHADAFRHRADVELLDARTVRATAPTWWDAWRAIYSLVAEPLTAEQDRAVLARQRHGHRPAVVIGGDPRHQRQLHVRRRERGRDRRRRELAVHRVVVAEPVPAEVRRARLRNQAPVITPQPSTCTPG